MPDRISAIALVGPQFPQLDVAYLWIDPACQLLFSDAGADISGRRTPADSTETPCCRKPDGTLLWQRRQDSDCRCVGQNGRELLLQEYTREGSYLVRLNLTTGQELGRSGGVIGAHINHTVWEHGSWWIIHDGLLFNGRTWSRNAAPPGYHGTIPLFPHGS